jgi:DNA-binding transcriptional MerR regulator
VARQTARAGAAASPALLSIGQVLARLTPEFPDLSSSKLRFLEERGLITPARTQSGYRKFSPADLDRLRIILGMQRDHYLPLKVIKAYLADLDAGLRECGASPELLHEAVTASVIAPAEVYGEESYAVLKALVELQRNGIEPRHLRGFRVAAERELSLIETALVPVARRNDVSSRAKTAELAREISGQLDVVRSSLIRSALSRIQS